jgi:hypothetical protein
LLSLASYCYRHRQTLFGVAHASGSGFGPSSTSIAFAAALGGGVDVKLFPRLSWRPAQVEYLLTRFPETTTNRETQNNLRVSNRRRFPFLSFTSRMGLLGFPAANFKQQSKLTCH